MLQALFRVSYAGAHTSGSYWGLVSVASVSKYLFCNSRCLERFSIECRKTKTNAITLTNHSRRKQHINQSEFEANTCNRRQAREKRVRASHDWFWFYFSLVDKVTRALLTNHRSVVRHYESIRVSIFVKTDLMQSSKLMIDRAIVTILAL